MNRMQDLKKSINEKQKTEQTKNILSYDTFISDMMAFRRAGTVGGDAFNYLDTPTHLYFKILFNFWNGDSINPGNKISSGGLLSPTWKVIDINDKNYYKYNSAWSYLKLNGENDRADKLVSFVELLSNISTYSPWYFMGIEGLDAARTRNAPETGELKFDERQKITIKCLKDSYDDRIGTLLDLYRDIVWSWSMKREVLPANMRKFDMGIYIFSSPIYNIHDAGKQYAEIGEGNGKYITSYKYIEFHNCEISYNSSLAAMGSLDNAAGVSPEYSIDIYFDDVYENRYNEFMMKNIGDMILYDTAKAIKTADNVETNISKTSESQDSNKENISELDRRLSWTELPEEPHLIIVEEEKKKKKKGPLMKMLEDAGNRIIEGLKTKGRSIYLGNIFGFSIRETTLDYENLIKHGKLTTAEKVIKDMTRVKRPPSRLDEIRNMYTNKSIKNNI